MTHLTGKTVAIIVSDFVEEPELIEPRNRLQDGGATVRIYSVSGEPVQLVRGDTDPTQKVDVDGTLDDLDPGAISALVVPGGTVNADRLRTEPRAQDIVREV